MSKRMTSYGMSHKEAHMVRMTPAEMEQERRRMDEKAKAEALAAEDAAAHNYQRIRQLERRIEVRHKAVEKLEKRITESDTEATGWIESLQEVNGAMRSDIVLLMQHCTQLEHTLSDARRDHAVLVRLVERIGLNFDAHVAVSGHVARRPRYIYNLVGQREHDAAQHDAEGAPVTREDCVP